MSGGSHESSGEDEPCAAYRVSKRERDALLRPATTLHISGKNVRMGDRVKARYQASSKGAARTFWFEGEIVNENDDGTVAVRYDDGDYEDRVQRMYVRPL